MPIICITFTPDLDLKMKTRLEFLEPVVRMFSDLWSRGEEEGEAVCWRTVWRPETGGPGGSV